MTKLRKPASIDAAFNSYVLTDLLGEGGAGRVFGGTDSAGASVAVKLLSNSTLDKKKRFKNEISFLMRNKHPNIVTVTDYGLAQADSIAGPFYVMARYDHSLRHSIEGKLPPDGAMSLFSQLLDGVEAAHLQNVTHRDLKPENVLIGNGGRLAVVADFGIAAFTADQLATLVETKPTSRLANFQYAAPEQRANGADVNVAADIYALGLILNEIFTGVVPHGTDYKLIASLSSEWSFLDAVVSEMIRQNPKDRPQSVATVKGLIQRHRADAVSLQKLKALEATVVPVGEIDDPLAHTPPKIVHAEHRDGVLHLTLDRPVNPKWVHALQNMGGHTSVYGAGPESFRFNRTQAEVNVADGDSQRAIDFFKQWLPRASAVLKYNLEREHARAETDRLARLQRERQQEERRLAVNRSLKI